MGDSFRCKRCGIEYPEAFYRISRVLNILSTRRSLVCRGCENTAHDQAKEKDRWAVKVRSTIRNHAKKYIDRGLVQSVDEFVERFGWYVDDMKHDAEHVYKNGCHVCRRAFASMAHGLGDLTLDIVNPSEQPFYLSNTKWICRTCNREKGRTSPHLWAEMQVQWRRWEQRQIQLTSRPYIGPLFEWAPPGGGLA
jgi:hypothetical protein